MNLRSVLRAGRGHQLPPTERKRPADTTEQDCQDGWQWRRTAPTYWSSHIRWTDRVGKVSQCPHERYSVVGASRYVHVHQLSWTDFFKHIILQSLQTGTLWTWSSVVSVWSVLMAPPGLSWVTPHAPFSCCTVEESPRMGATVGTTSPCRSVTTPRPERQF